jgi:hypothetical protein
MAACVRMVVVRYLPCEPSEASRRRATVAELQAASILRAAQRAALTEETGGGDDGAPREAF